MAEIEITHPPEMGTEPEQIFFPLDFVLKGEQILAENVSFETFVSSSYGGRRVEWVEGTVITMSPVTEEHNDLTGFLIAFFRALPWVGRVMHEPMVMYLTPGETGRSPDVMVVLPENTGRIRKTYLDGPADLIIEIVSKESHRRDRVLKFAEYERGGVQEYWIIDPLRQECLYYLLSPEGKYEQMVTDENGQITSHVMPELTFPAGLFLQNPLPQGLQFFQLLQSMLNTDTP